jgi:uncharacterized membrane protein
MVSIGLTSGHFGRLTGKAVLSYQQGLLLLLLVVLVLVVVVVLVLVVVVVVVVAVTAAPSEARTPALV